MPSHDVSASRTGTLIQPRTQLRQNILGTSALCSPHGASAAHERSVETTYPKPVQDKHAELTGTQSVNVAARRALDRTDAGNAVVSYSAESRAVRGWAKRAGKGWVLHFHFVYTYGRVSRFASSARPGKTSKSQHGSSATGWQIVELQPWASRSASAAQGCVILCPYSSETRSDSGGTGSKLCTSMPFARSMGSARGGTRREMRSGRTESSLSLIHI